jgi:hypothetical protein
VATKILGEILKSKHTLFIVSEEKKLPFYYQGRENTA